MRILVITDSYPPHHSGGYEIRCRDVLEQLILRGHDIEIITNKTKHDKRNPRINNHNIYRRLNVEVPTMNLLGKLFHDYQDIKFLDQRIKSFQPDIIYLWHIINLSRAIFPYLAEANIPIVFDEGGKGIVYSRNHRGAWYYFVEHHSTHGILNRIKPIVINVINALSQNNLKRQWVWPTQLTGYFNSSKGMDFAKENRFPLIKCSVIQSGLNLSDFVFKPKTEIEYPIHLLLPGRIYDQKGQKDVVQLLHFLQLGNIDAQVTLVGAVFSDSYYIELLNDIEIHGLTSKISILPQIKHRQMEGLYHSADICFFPSYQRIGLSRIPIEAMASGCLVITYGNEGTSEIIINNENGFIVPEGNFEMITRIVREMVISPDQYVKIIQRARKHIEQNHDMDRYVDRIEGFLNKSSDEHHRRI